MHIHMSNLRELEARLEGLRTSCRTRELYNEARRIKEEYVTEVNRRKAQGPENAELELRLTVF